MVNLLRLLPTSECHRTGPHLYRSGPEFQRLTTSCLLLARTHTRTRSRFILIRPPTNTPHSPKHRSAPHAHAHKSISLSPRTIAQISARPRDSVFALCTLGSTPVRDCTIVSLSRNRCAVCSLYHRRSLLPTIISIQNKHTRSPLCRFKTTATRLSTGRSMSGTGWHCSRGEPYKNERDLAVVAGDAFLRNAFYEANQRSTKRFAPQTRYVWHSVCLTGMISRSATGGEEDRLSISLHKHTDTCQETPIQVAQTRQGDFTTLPK